MSQKPLSSRVARDSITVFPLPPVLQQNPYLDLLYGPLQEYGAHVRRGRPRSELPRLALTRGKRVLHIHFFDEFIQQPSVGATAARCMLLLLLLLLLRLCGVRLVWTAHNLLPHEARYPFWSFFVYRVLVRWSDAIIFHSVAARGMFLERYGMPRRCEVIPHGNYIGAYGPRQPQAEARAALGLPLEGRVLLAFGVLRPYKHVEDLIDAFAALPPEQRGVLLIAGAAKSKAYAAAIERRAADVSGVIVRRGFVADHVLPQYFAAADVVVVPYPALLSSGVLLCALSYGRPVVAADTGPVRELVHDNVEGFLFASANPHGLRSALERAETTTTLAAMGAAAFARAQTFDWPGIAAQTAQVYAHVCR